MKILGIGFSKVLFFNENVKEEAESRGHTMDICSASALTVDVGPDGVSMQVSGTDLQDYDVIHVGAISRNRWPVISALGYLNKVSGCVVVDGRIIHATLDQYSGLANYFLEFEHDIHLPRSITFKRVKEIESRLKEFVFPVIVKTSSSKQGRGVGLANDVGEIRDFVDGHISQDEKVDFVLRERIPNDGDYRVNVIDGKAVVCLKRNPKKGEFRSNISLGGDLLNTDHEDVSEICAAGEKIARLANYDIAGVDVMVHKETGVPYVLEVNRAPSGLEDDVEVSGIDIAKLIVDMYEKHFKKKKVRAVSVAVDLNSASVKI